MIEVRTGERLWERFADLTSRTGRRRAAIAYIGPDANEYLHLGAGDVLIFDGDDRSIKGHHVDLPTVDGLLRAGVRLYSYAGLHAKMMVIEAERPLAIVGSPNATRTSVEKKSEAAVTFDDADAVQAVRLAIFELQAEARPVGRAWLQRVSTLATHERKRGSRVTRPPASRILADPSRPLWIVGRAPAGTRPRSAAPSGRGAAPVVETVALTRHGGAAAFESIDIDDSIVLVTWSGGTRRPRASATVREPGKVLARTPDPHGGGTLVVAWRHDAGRTSWREIAAILAPYGDGWDGAALRPAARRAVWKALQNVR